MDLSENSLFCVYGISKMKLFIHHYILIYEVFLIYIGSVDSYKTIN